MTVSFTREDYNNHERKWAKTRNVVESNVRNYIDPVDPTDEERNKKYINDAQFTNFTGRTKHGLVGAIFRRKLIADLPPTIQYAVEDVTGSGMGLNKLAQEITGELLITGRYGLLVDFPALESPATLAELEQNNIKARIYRYRAESIINWKTDLINGQPKLTLVVLKECLSQIDPDDGFKWSNSDQYRVLRLIDGVYVQDLYNKDEEMVSRQVVLDYSGNPFDHIPFFFAGSEDNDSELDNIPLYDLALLNIGHLKNSADYEESVHIVGQPTVVFATDYSPEQFADANPGGIRVGARRGHNLGPGGSATFLQASPNQLADSAMQRKEEQAVMIGARLITATADRETAEAARMRYSGETSVLSTIADNVENVLEQCCKELERFSGNTTGDIKITVNKHFFDKNIDPNLIMAQIQLAEKKVLSKVDIRQTLREHGIVPETRSDSDIDADINKDPVQVDQNNNFPTNGT